MSLIGRAKHAFKLGEVAEQTWSKVKTWMVRQWAPTVAMVLHATGGDMSCLQELADLGEVRLRDSHRRLVSLAGRLPAVAFTS